MSEPISNHLKEESAVKDEGEDTNAGGSNRDSSVSSNAGLVCSFGARCHLCLRKISRLTLITVNFLFSHHEEIDAGRSSIIIR
jgi:hypothetical protein